MNTKGGAATAGAAAKPSSSHKPIEPIRNANEDKATTEKLDATKSVKAFQTPSAPPESDLPPPPLGVTGYDGYAKAANAGKKTPPPVPKRTDSLLPSRRPESRPYRSGYESDVEDNYGSHLHKSG